MHRSLTPLFALFLLVGGGLQSASGQTITSMHLWSLDPNEYLSQGQDLTFTPATGTFNVFVNFRSGVTAIFQDSNNENLWWRVELSAPNNELIVPGQVYEGAVFFNTVPLHLPGVGASTYGRWCQQMGGRFECRVNDSDFSEVRHLWVLGELDCDYMGRKLQFDIRYKVDQAVPTLSRTWGDLKTKYR